MKNLCKLTVKCPRLLHTLPRFLLLDEELQDISTSEVLYALLLDRASISTERYIDPDARSVCTSR
jgi:hypothetical protein